MNAHVKPIGQALTLVEVIDLKWLLAHEGHSVHVERLQSDLTYALRCLDLAAQSPHAATRAAGARLQAQLDMLKQAEG